jgi:hypothetical protein
VAAHGSLAVAAATFSRNVIVSKLSVGVSLSALEKVAAPNWPKMLVTNAEAVTEDAG